MKSFTQGLALKQRRLTVSVISGVICTLFFLQSKAVCLLKHFAVLTVYLGDKVRSLDMNVEIETCLCETAMTAHSVIYFLPTSH